MTGDGTETRDWTFIDDILDGVLAMGVKHEAIGEAINLGSGTENRVIDLAQTVNELTGNAEGVVYAQRRNWDTKTHLLSSIEKAEKLLGYHPQTKFEDGLKSVHRWLVENWEAIEKTAVFEHGSRIRRFWLVAVEPNFLP